MLGKIVGANNAGITRRSQGTRIINLSGYIVYFTTDINPHACSATRKTGLHNGIPNVEPVQTTLASSLLPRLYHAVDVLCFNPPYVVTPPEEVGGQGIEAAWAGGIDGRQVIDEMLPFVEV